MTFIIQISEKSPTEFKKDSNQSNEGDTWIHFMFQVHMTGTPLGHCSQTVHLQSSSHVAVLISAVQTSCSLVSLQQIPVKRKSNARKTLVQYIVGKGGRGEGGAMGTQK